MLRVLVKGFGPYSPAIQVVVSGQHFDWTQLTGLLNIPDVDCYTVQGQHVAVSFTELADQVEVAAATLACIAKAADVPASDLVVKTSDRPLLSDKESARILKKLLKQLRTVTAPAAVDVGRIVFRGTLRPSGSDRIPRARQEHRSGLALFMFGGPSDLTNYLEAAILALDSLQTSRLLDLEKISGRFTQEIIGNQHHSHQRH